MSGGDGLPHRRRNPLSGEWVIVSPQRTERPWQGSTGTRPISRPHYDPDCYLCPGNQRAGQAVNPHYRETFVFDNDFAALLDDPAFDPTDDPLFGTDRARGVCRVLCFSPRHDLTLAEMDHDQRARVIDLWVAQQAELAETWRWVQLFETRGEIAGASNPHPHGQVWASAFLPDLPARELDNQRRYRADTGRPLLLDYAERELERGERLVVANEHWLVLVPYWAYWPFETLVLPRRSVSSLVQLDEGERQALAAILGDMLSAFDALFAAPFPYCSGWHSAPSDSTPDDGWQLHAHYLPPLLRSATVAKIPASYELLSGVQRDLTAEQAAQRLRDAAGR